MAAPSAISQPMHSSRAKHGTGGMEMSFRKLHLSPEDAERAWFAGLLWKAFPDATSESELAEMAADILADRPSLLRGALPAGHEAGRVFRLAVGKVLPADQGLRLRRA